MEPHWVVWARRLRAIAQTGLAYGESEFDLERYRELMEIADEIMASHAGVDHPFLRDFFAHDSGYATPQLDVRAGVFRDGQVLLVREWRDGLWTVPGGYVDVNDPPSRAIEREVEEESGFQARATKLAMVLDKSRHHPPSPRHTYKLFFICEITGGEARTSFETVEVGFFALDALPDLSPHRVTAAQIARMFEHFRNPELRTDFD